MPWLSNLGFHLQQAPKIILSSLMYFTSNEETLALGLNILSL
jgi:hypothetical protein